MNHCAGVLEEKTVDLPDGLERHEPTMLSNRLAGTETKTKMKSKTVPFPSDVLSVESLPATDITDRLA